jgi:Ser/Thr protein kinase RdoA (MazF antagonist)
VKPFQGYYKYNMGISDSDLITLFLNRMAWTPGEPFEHRILQKGYSGSYVYQVSFPESQAVLKIALAEGGALAIERFHRERMFYRDLADIAPLRTPMLLKAYEGPEGGALMFAAYQPAIPPGRWVEEDFLEAARQLGELHGRFWSQTESLASRPWLKRPMQTNLIADTQKAYRDWDALQRKPEFSKVLTGEAIQTINALLERSLEIRQIIDSFPVTLCHGDCNTTNVLRDAQNNFIWIDWQEVGLGRGPEDLSFLLQRASAEGVSVPVQAVLPAYQSSLAARAGISITVEAIRQVMDAADLLGRLLYWPFYLSDSSEEKVRDMLESIYRLSSCIK